MSLENAKAFIDRIKTDEDFRKNVSECKDNEARKNLVVKEGFEFTVEDLKSARGELSEEDLNLVSAGVINIKNLLQW